MNAKKYVAVFRNNFLPYSETFIHEELKHHERYEPTVFARTWRNTERFPGHRVIYLEKIPGQKKPLEKFIYNRFRKSWSFEKEFRQSHFDLLHAHFGYNGTYAAPFARKYSLPLVVTMHGHDVTILCGQEKFKRHWKDYTAHFDELLETARLFLCVSDDLLNMLISIGCPRNKLLVHRPGIDLSMFVPPAEPVTKKHVVMIGRFVEKKGFEYGIRAFAKTLRKTGDAELTIVGDGPLRSAYEQVIRDHGIQKRVTFTGELMPRDVIKILRQTRVILAPSVTPKNEDKEGIPSIIKESLACGVPVIGSRHGGIPEIIDDGINGFLAQERDVDALSECLIHILNNDHLRHDMGQNARLKMERNYDIRITNQRLESIYDSVLS
ncbi:glycosyltransferase [bacterium]|nr:glycosyltransferase [bacterium]